MTLVERLDAQVVALRAERDRIVADASRDVTAVEEKMATLTSARKAITGEVEAAYVALRKLGLIADVVA